MKRNFLIIFLLILSLSFVSAISITEVELNPEGSDSGNEWIEFYSEDSVDLSEFKIVNNDEDELIIDIHFSGYFVYTFEKQWLDNSDEKISIYNDSELIFETDLFEDISNDDLTWQFCENWIFEESTKNKENCEEDSKQEEIEEEEVIEEEQDNEENEEESEKEDSKKTKEDEEKDESNNEIKEIEEEIEPIVFETISLDAKNIKSEDNLENSRNNYPLYGLFGFCILLGMLFLFRKKKTEFD